ncbi:MAG TPA: ABC transporter ATP-binding protein [Anaerolineaceae bacterium]
MPNNEKPIVICENLVKIYKVANLEVVALQGLDLHVPRGEMLGIVGNSGSGKSTLMNILGGLDHPSAGKVLVDGMDLLKITDRDLIHYQRSKVGFVWQQASRNLIPYLSAQENVELPMTMAWVNSRKKKNEWSKELLNLVGLYSRRTHRLVELSGGEQQRVAIAVALANKPVLLLGDEPTGEVDTATAQMIVQIFRNLNQQMGLTTIIVTHDPRLANQLDRVVAIRDGKISTETVRQVSRKEVAGNDEEDSSTIAKQLENKEKENVTYQEYVVLDSAGRLQIPREWLERLQIGKRARLALEDGNIRIQPVEGQEGGIGRKLTLEEQLALLFEDQPPKPKKSLFTRFAIIGRKERGND